MHPCRGWGRYRGTHQSLPLRRASSFVSPHDSTPSTNGLVGPLSTNTPSCSRSRISDVPPSQSNQPTSIPNSTSLHTTDPISEPDNSEGLSQHTDQASGNGVHPLHPGINPDEILRPEGQNGFFPSNNASRLITDIIKRRLHGGNWQCYSDVPPHEKEIWFNEWKKEVYYNPRDEQHMKKAFKFKAGSHLRYIWYNARKKDQKPNFIDAEVWTKAKRTWNTPCYKKKRAVAKQNRASETGGALHRMGSISAGTHIMRIAKKTGKKPKYIEFFDDMHKMPDGRFVDARSERTSKAVHEVLDSQSADIDQTEEIELQGWREALGGPSKKGTDYGIHYVRSNINCALDATQSYTDPVVQQQLDTLSQKVNDSQQKMEGVMDQVTSQQHQMTSMMEQMMTMIMNGRGMQTSHNSDAQVEDDLNDNS